jgi:hypothetical protein
MMIPSHRLAIRAVSLKRELKETAIRG